jgi:hypothetical protein
MDNLQVYTKNDLGNFLLEVKNAQFEQIVHRIVSKIHTTVVILAKKGMTKYTWNWVDVSRYEVYNKHECPQLMHLLEACKRLQFLFPDSKITRPTAWGICVDWS